MTSLWVRLMRYVAKSHCEFGEGARCAVHGAALLETLGMGGQLRCTWIGGS